MAARSGPVRVAVVGAGYMGSAHARVVARIAREYPGLAVLAYTVDVDYERARSVAARYGGQPLRSARELPEDSVDLAIVAVPTRFHLQVFQELLSRGVRGFLVEKPLATDAWEAGRLVDEARDAGAWVAVGHVERFNPAVVALHGLLAGDRIGKVLTLAARRVGPFAPRAGDTDVVYDLGVHEVDNALAVMGEAPGSVRGYTLPGIVTSLNDHALIVLVFSNGIGSLEVNRITPYKQRVLYATGSRGVAYLDYMRQTLRLYYPEGELSVEVQREEPLLLEDLSAVAAYAQAARPLVDMYQGLLAMLACGAALESSKRGRELALEEYEAWGSYSREALEALEGYRRYRSLVKECWSEPAECLTGGHPWRRGEKG